MYQKNWNVENENFCSLNNLCQNLTSILYDEIDNIVVTSRKVESQVFIAFAYSLSHEKSLD